YAVLVLATLLSTGLAVWLFVRNSVLKERLAAQEKAAEEKLSVLNDAQQKLSDAFKALSADALNSNNRAFLELANTALSRFQEGARSELESRQQAITETLKPLKESLEVVGTKI